MPDFQPSIFVYSNACPCARCRWTAQRRIEYRPDEYKAYPSDDHQAMDRLNKMFLHVGGSPDDLPYPKITQPKPGITHEHFVGAQPAVRLRLSPAVQEQLEQLQQQQQRRSRPLEEIIAMAQRRQEALVRLSTTLAAQAKDAEARDKLYAAADLEAAIDAFQQGLNCQVCTQQWLPCAVRHRRY